MPIARRSLLLAGSTAALALPFANPGQARAALPTTPADGGRASVALLGATNYTYSEAFDKALPYLSLGGCEIRGSATELSGARLLASFDPRVQSWSGGEAVLVSSSISARLTSRINSGQLEVTLPDFGDSSATVSATVSLPLTYLDLYPRENIGSPSSPRVELVDARGSGLAPTPVGTAGTAPVAGAVWGVEQAAVWTEVDTLNTGSRHSYSIPAFIAVRSVGPGAMPSGTTIEIACDRAVIAGLVVEPVVAETSRYVSLSQSAGASATTLTHRFVFTRPLPAGEGLSVTVSPRLTRSPRVGDGVTFARVTVAGDSTRSPLQRVTGNESLVALSNSGIPRVDHTASGKN